MQLKNNRLLISFAEPEQIRTQRFDHTAMVTQVVLDGKYSFCTPEQVLPYRKTTNGMGLCGEFVFEGAAENVQAGQWFCKPGVGLLRQMQDYQPYDMWQNYECHSAPVKAEYADDRITFVQKGIISNGYGIDIEKTFWLQDNRLILDIRAKNTGTMGCCLKEYQHNFVSLDGLPVNQGYVLELSCDKLIKQIENKTLRQGDEIVLPSAVEVQNNKIYWQRDMEGRVLYHCSREVQKEAPYCWTLGHLQSPLTVSEQTGFRPSRIDVWAVEHCICTEFYYEAEIMPGETAEWRRTWTFED